LESKDYKNRAYLSAIEAAKYLNISVGTLHQLALKSAIAAELAASGQMRFRLDELRKYESQHLPVPKRRRILSIKESPVNQNGTTQRVIASNAMQMREISNDSVHFMVTSPPYFNAKMYAREPLENDLGDIHSESLWFEKIGEVWREVFRVLQPGRKAFINIMNLPVRLSGGGYRTINLVGKTIELCEKVGFVFKRDIVWQKTNGVRAHFGTYPYPGGILINTMHEFILEFDKPMKKGFKKYAHLTREQKERSKLTKDFWLSLKNSDVWEMKPEASGAHRTHVAPYPYELPYRLIKAFTYIGETVLDPFLGSGTTLRAACDLERNGIGYEINPEIAYEAVHLLKHKEKLKSIQTRAARK
jgi:DNA modification methylase